MVAEDYRPPTPTTNLSDTMMDLNDFQTGAESDIIIDNPKPEPVVEGRGHRRKLIRKHLHDYLPSSNLETTRMSQYAEIKSPPSRHWQPPKVEEEQPSESDSELELDNKPAFTTTDPNIFGLFRQYKTLPSWGPEKTKTLIDVCDAPTFATATTGSTPALSIYGPHTASAMPTSIPSMAPSSSDSDSQWFALFLNATVCRLMIWFYSSTTKTLSDLNRLVHDGFR
ncbi:uncharacterized protein EV420DRAFT_1770804 [Desarmillaria tabescens]|uniref:Uncharacterized protein n=1 Tax=Armillaria tabescens TaxID=1929756 RepID=A0AA39MIS5_ARMTA|nr:uncharacterized protein EV420DRAFT_1770804 [Desarmillaria tabescens]KAK0434990.1 hypothetical protein EV420DRAFT_1770804 [Desarmillaria tabescens]